VHAGHTRAYPNLIIGVAEKGTPGLDTWSTTIKTLRLIMSEIEQNNYPRKERLLVATPIERMTQQQTRGAVQACFA
jgi:hypothetical protein